MTENRLRQKRPRVHGDYGFLPGVHGEVRMALRRLRAPFPAFGGKSKVAGLVWSRLGDVDNYCEPFCHSAAVLLARPHPPRVETLNDLDCMVANFWRATQHDPEAVALHADWPVNEADLHARHRFLVLSEVAADFRQRMRTDPDYYDVKFAGWWVWGACCWIGGGWCVDPEHGPVHGTVGGSGERPPHLHGNNGTSGKGVHAKGDGTLSQQVPRDGARFGMADLPGVLNPAGDGHRPQLADAYARGRGVHGTDAADHYLFHQRPVIANSGGGGHGIHAGDRSGEPGTCASRRAWLVDWFGRLRDRLRTVRVCSGHWLRVCDSESVTTRLGVTGLFADPPYPTHHDGKESRSEGLYATDGGRDELDALRDEVLSYCLERGGNPLMRIVVAGYAGDGYEALLNHGWSEEEWRAQGGYGNRSKRGKANRSRERLWVSPHCVKGNTQTDLFDFLAPNQETR